MLTPRGFLTLLPFTYPLPLPSQNPSPHQGLGLWKGKGIGQMKWPRGYPCSSLNLAIKSRQMRLLAGTLKFVCEVLYHSKLDFCIEQLPMISTSMLKISSLPSNLEPAVECKPDCIQMSASKLKVTCCLSVLNRNYVFGVPGFLDYSGVYAPSISSSSNDLHHHEAAGVLGGCFGLQIQSQQVGDHQQKMLRHDLY